MSETKERRGTKKNWSVIACAFILLLNLVLTGIVFILFCSHDSEQADTGYMGIIVAVLSVLVTLLIGWNIYSVIDTKEISKIYSDRIARMEEDNKELNKKIRQMERRCDFFGKKILAIEMTEHLQQKKNH